MAYLPTQQNVSAGVYPGSGVARGGQVGRPEQVHNGIGATPIGAGLNTQGSIRRPPNVPVPVSNAQGQPAAPGHVPIVMRRAVLAGRPPLAQGQLGSGTPGDAGGRIRPASMDARF